jgi:hypothetical protein
MKQNIREKISEEMSDYSNEQIVATLFEVLSNYHLGQLLKALRENY